jgi:nucleoside-diphosphate-sugar epimerase
MKVFLTGSTGYIGNQLALALAKDNFRVNALVRNPKSNRAPKHKNIKIFKGDICELNSIRKAIKNCDYVCHTAAFTDLKYEHVDKFYETNVIGTKNVLEAAFESGVEKFLYTSTLSVFGPALYHVPITEHQPRLNSINNDYELTKAMSEELVLMYANKGLPSCILNVSRVYGPGLNTYSNGVNKIIQKIMNDKILVVPSNLEVEANYVYIDDVINGQITALRSGISGEHYIIGGENADYNKLFGLAKDVSNSKIKIIKINYKLIRNLIKFQANINLLFGLKSLVTPKVLDSLFTHRSASSLKAISTLNYKITPLQIGIEKTIKFLKIQAS